MATSQELAFQYAQDIENALARDNFNPSTRINSHSFKFSKTYQAILDTRRSIDNLVYTSNNQPLSKADKELIYSLIVRELNNNRRFSTYSSVRKSILFEAASNDHLTDLGDTIETILRGNA